MHGECSPSARTEHLLDQFLRRAATMIVRLKWSGVGSVGATTRKLRSGKVSRAMLRFHLVQRVQRADALPSRGTHHRVGGRAM